VVENGSGVVQKSLATCQGKTVPGAVLLVAVGRSVPGGPPRPLVGGCAGNAVGSVQGLSLRVDTLSSLSLMRSVKWCRERQMTVYGLSYISWSSGMCLSCLTNTVGALARSSGSCGGGVVSSGSMFGSTQCLRKLPKKNFRRKLSGCAGC
jgi:hypothetical protein